MWVLCDASHVHVRAVLRPPTTTSRDVERSTMLGKEGSGGSDSGGGGGDQEAPAPAPKVDLSLKQGEKIKISIGGGSKARFALRI